MKGFLKGIDTVDFRKLFKRLLILGLVVVIACGTLTAFLFRTQLTQLLALEKMEEEIQMPMTGYGCRRYGECREIDVFEAGLVTRPSAGAIITAVTSVVLCSLCVLAYWLLVAAWLYQASGKAGMNRALWTILGLACNVLAVLAFLVVRGSLVSCPNCGAWQKGGSFCVRCGGALGTACPNCGRRCKASDKFCPDCGAELTNKDANEVQS